MINTVKKKSDQDVKDKCNETEEKQKLHLLLSSGCGGDF